MIVSIVASIRRPPRPPRTLAGWLRLFSLRHEPRDTRPTPGAAITESRAPASQSDGGDDFERFFTAHEALVTGYLYRVIGDAQSAADLSQETFLRAWSHFDRIRGYERPGAWLVRVATNLALQHRRRSRAPVGAAIPLDESHDLGASDPGSRIAERDLVRAALLDLPPKPRAMLVLREVYGLTGDEVAETLGMSHEAVKVALWRARTQFRAAYLRREERP
jgi:RNA polymerase sigma-70 factor (ECF subfamily)